MNGWLYLIQNGNLYKIGITRKFNTRMRQLKPDNIIAKLYSSNFRQLERELHKKYHSVRIPQTEYFRLNAYQVKEIKEKLIKLYYPSGIASGVFKKVLLLLLFFFVSLILIISLNSNNIRYIILRSIFWLERISFVLSIFSICTSSKKHLSLLNEFKFRMSRSLFLILFSFFFRFIQYLFNISY